MISTAARRDQRADVVARGETEEADGRGPPNGLAEPPMRSGRGCSRSTTLQQGSRSAAGVRRQLAAPTPSSPPLAYDAACGRRRDVRRRARRQRGVRAATSGSRGSSRVAAKGLAVLTCMDSRIEPLAMLGLAPGDAKILRNAGARVTDDVLRTLVLASYLLGVDRAMIVAHTKCRMASGEEDDVHDAVADAGGPDTRSLAFLVSSDQEETVRDDVQRVRSWPYLTQPPRRRVPLRRRHRAPDPPLLSRRAGPAPTGPRRFRLSPAASCRTRAASSDR